MQVKFKAFALSYFARSTKAIFDTRTAKLCDQTSGRWKPSDGISRLKTVGKDNGNIVNKGRASEVKNTCYPLI